MMFFQNAERKTEVSWKVKVQPPEVCQRQGYAIFERLQCGLSLLCWRNQFESFVLEKPIQFNTLCAVLYE